MCVTSSFGLLGKLSPRTPAAMQPSAPRLRGFKTTVTPTARPFWTAAQMLIEAESDAQAAELARSCPVFEYDGSVEVRPIMEREM